MSHWHGKRRPYMCLPPGVLKFGFGREVPPRNLKVDPYKYQFVKKKRVTHSYTNRSNFGAPILSKITRFFPKIFLKFEPILAQILKTRPIHIPNFAFYKGSFIYQETDFATHGGT